MHKFSELLKLRSMEKVIRKRDDFCSGCAFIFSSSVDI